MTEYKIKVKKGINDLKSIFPYYGDWSDFNSYYGYTEEQYLSNKKEYEDRINEDNKKYILDLIDKKEYGLEVELAIEIQENPAFDKSEIEYNYPLSNYKMVILDI